MVVMHCLLKGITPFEIPPPPPPYTQKGLNLGIVAKKAFKKLLYSFSGATTFIVTTLSRMTLSKIYRKIVITLQLLQFIHWHCFINSPGECHSAECHSDECHYAECCSAEYVVLDAFFLSCILPNVILLNVIPMTHCAECHLAFC